MGRSYRTRPKKLGGKLKLIRTRLDLTQAEMIKSLDVRSEPLYPTYFPSFDTLNVVTVAKAMASARVCKRPPAPAGGLLIRGAEVSVGPLLSRRDPRMAGVVGTLRMFPTFPPLPATLDPLGLPISV